MVTQQIGDYEAAEKERLKNVHEYYYKRGLQAIEKNFITNLILLAISVLLFIGIETIVIIGKRVEQATKPSDYSGYTFLVIFVLIVFGLIIAVLVVANKLKDHKKWLKLGSIYPKQKHIYYSFDGDFSQIKNHNKYSTAVNNPDLVYCDPTYVHRVVPEWTQIDTQPRNIRWITPQVHRLQNSSLTFAILPLTAGTWREGPLVFRFFARNSTSTSKTLSLKYYPVSPTRELIRTPPLTFINVSVPGNCIVYRDILMYNRTGVYGMKGDVYSSPGMRVFAIVDWWTVVHENRVGDYIQRRTEYNSQIITVIPFFEEGTNPLKTTKERSMEYIKQLTKIFLIGQNPFISPSGMKEVLLYALTGGDMTSRELVRWEEENGKKWVSVLLIFGGISLVIFVLLLIFAEFNAIGIILALIILSVVGYLMNIASSIPESKHMDLLY